MPFRPNLPCLAILAAIMAATPLSWAQSAAPASPALEGTTPNSLPYVLDLSPSYTVTYKPEDKTGIAGHRMLDGLPFEINGEARLYGRSDAVRDNIYPMESDAIPIHRKFDEIHLIHAVQWREYNGCPVALLRLHYADGTANDLSIRFNVQVNDWNRLLSEEKEVT